jgi:hypothetical protein
VRRLTAAFVLLTFVMLAPVGCRRKKKGRTREDGLASTINVADPADSAQIVRGLSNVEADAWRWSTAKFSVVLRPPPASAQNGAKLELRFTLADAVVGQLGPVTVSAIVNGTPVAPETFSEAGDFVYSHDVPAAALGPDVITAEFSTDKALEPNDKDKRELALIVKTIGLVPK